jgi:hypothetical protein
MESSGSGVHKLVAAAGTIVNLVVGLGLLVVLRNVTIQNHALKLFVWLSMTINLLSATGYLLFSGTLGVGDWVTVVDGLQPVWAWRLILSVAGALSYLVCIKISLDEMNRFIGTDSERLPRAFRHTIVPFLVGSTTSTIGAVLNPISPLLIATSAASSFGGTSALAWMTQLLRSERFKPVDGDTLVVDRSWMWIGAATLLLLGHIFILGPSIGFA